MIFKIINDGKRRGIITTNHGKVHTPVFMPCATSGSVKGIDAQELKQIGFEIILSNTYHLYLAPGEKIIAQHGGVQQWMNWDGAILTDSGGYQAFSLGANFKPSENTKNDSLVRITSRGVWFRSHKDNSRHLFTPEKVIDIQLALGSDIIMPLDFCPSANASYEEIEQAVKITNMWFKRAFEYFQQKISRLKNPPAIFAIIQGGAEKGLREKSYNFLSQFPVQGFAIGGVANGGESKLKQRKALEYTMPLLPESKPRYLMGVGEPEDILYATKMGVDMFDCVLPTRLGRHGVVWITSDWKKFAKDDLRKPKNLTDKNVIMPKCQCPACRGGYTRAYISHLLRQKEMLGMRLASLHNLWILHELIKRIQNNH